MRTVILLAMSLFFVEARPRVKRQAYFLPDGANLIVGQIKRSFVCSRDGYYADVGNRCQIFHVCNTVVRNNEAPEMLQWSFFCGNQTIFDQFSLSCSYPQDAIPCENSPDFFYLNDRIGDPKAFFLEENDVQKAISTRGRIQPVAFAAPKQRPL